MLACYNYFMQYGQSHELPLYENRSIQVLIKCLHLIKILCARLFPYQSNHHIKNQYCPVKFYQAIFKEPPSCPANILPPKGEGAKVFNKQMLALFGGKWRVSAERGHEIHVSIKCKKTYLFKNLSAITTYFSVDLLTTECLLT